MSKQIGSPHFFSRARLIGGRALLVVFCLLAALLLFRLLVPLIAGRNLGVTEIGGDPYTHEITEPTLKLHFHDFTSGSRVGADLGMNADLVEVMVSPESSFIPQREVCIEKLHIDGQVIIYPRPYKPSAFFGSARGRSSFGGLNYEFTGFCASENVERLHPDLRPDERSVYGTSTNTVPVSVMSSYYFPFDQRALDMIAWLEASAEDANGGQTSLSIAPDIVGWVTAPEWDESISITKEYAEEHEHEVTHIHIDFHRPFAYRILTIVLIGSLSVFIFVLIFVKDTGEFLEVAIGVLLGLWGVQDILVPADVTWPTIIDSLILALYVFFAFAILVRFTVRPAWHWLGASSQATISEEEPEIPIVRISPDTPASHREHPPP